MTPWEVKRQIDVAFELADRYGFKLSEDPQSYGYPVGPIYLYAREDNKVFAKNMVLNRFDSWQELMFFFQGYEKADMACGMKRVIK